MLSVSFIDWPECFFDARQDGGKGVIFRTGEDLHVWRTKPAVFGVSDNNGLILMVLSILSVPVVWIQYLQGSDEV